MAAAVAVTAATSTVRTYAIVCCLAKHIIFKPSCFNYNSNCYCARANKQNQFARDFIICNEQICIMTTDKVIVFCVTRERDGKVESVRWKWVPCVCSWKSIHANRKNCIQYDGNVNSNSWNSNGIVFAETHSIRINASNAATTNDGILGQSVRNVLYFIYFATRNRASAFML